MPTIKGRVPMRFLLLAAQPRQVPAVPANSQRAGPSPLRRWRQTDGAALRYISIVSRPKRVHRDS